MLLHLLYHTINILSFIPIIVLIISLVFVVKVFDTSAMEGASQIALLVASAVCVFIGMIIFKIPWQSFEDGIKENIANLDKIFKEEG